MGGYSKSIAGIRDAINVQRDFGAVGNGDHDDAPHFNAAIDYVAERGGGRIYVPTPPVFYLCLSRVLLHTDFIDIEGASTGVELRAGVNNMTLVHVAAAHCRVARLWLNADLRSGTTNFLLGPADLAQTTTVIKTNVGAFEDLFITDGDEGVVLTTGPTVSGVQSDCSYSRFDGIKVRDCKRGFLLKQHDTSANAASPDSNQFWACLVYQERNNRANTAYQIDAGSTNTFDGCSSIGMAYLTAPNTVPTGIRIKGRARAGADNNNNKFKSQRSEYDTRPLEVTSPGGYFNEINGTGFDTYVDNGVGTIIENTPQVHKSTWFFYSSADAIAKVGVSTYPIWLRPQTSLQGEVAAGGSGRHLIGLDSNDVVRLARHNSLAASSGEPRGTVIIGDGIARETKVGLVAQTSAPNTTIEWDISDNYDFAKYLVHAANEGLDKKALIEVNVVRKTTGGADSTMASIVHQQGNEVFTVSVVDDNTIRLTSAGNGFYGHVVCIEGRHML